MAIHNIFLVIVCNYLLAAVSGIVPFNVARKSSFISGITKFPHDIWNVIDGIFHPSNYMYIPETKSPEFTVIFRGRHFVQDVRIVPLHIADKSNLAVYMKGYRYHALPITYLPNYTVESTSSYQYLKYTPTIVLAYETVNISCYGFNMSLIEVEVYVYTRFNFKPASATLVLNDMGCYNFSWTPPDTEVVLRTKYEFRCGAEIRWEPVGEILEIVRCDVDIYKEATCEVGAYHASGVTVGTAAPCHEPTVRDKLEVNDEGITSVTATVSWKAPKAPCDFANSYIMTLRKGTDVVANVTAGRFKTTVTIEDLPPYTEYTFTLRTFSDRGIEGTIDIVWITRDMIPVDAPSLHLWSTSSCLHLNITSPTQKNGLITRYMWICESRNYKNSSTIQAQDTNDGAITMDTICHFPSQTRIYCSVTAFNAAGESPAAASYHIMPRFLPPRERHRSTHSPIIITKPKSGTRRRAHSPLIITTPKSGTHGRAHSPLIITTPKSGLLPATGTHGRAHSPLIITTPKSGLLPSTERHRSTHSPIIVTTPKSYLENLCSDDCLAVTVMSGFILASLAILVLGSYHIKLRKTGKQLILPKKPLHWSTVSTAEDSHPLKPNLKTSRESRTSNVEDSHPLKPNLKTSRESRTSNVMANKQLIHSQKSTRLRGYL